MVLTDLEFHAEASLYRGSISLYGRGRLAMKRFEIKSVEMGEVSEGAPVPPFMELDPQSAQALADALWVAGVRPTQGKNSEGVAGAMGKHLEDMRALAFHKIGAEKP